MAGFSVEELCEVSTEAPFESLQNDVNYFDILCKVDKIVINTIHSDKRLFIFTKSGQHEIKWLVDTGAAVSVVEASLLKNIWNDCKMLPVKPPKIVSATDHEFKTLGVILMKLDIEGKTIEHPFIAVKGLKSKAILGDDFLRINKAHIDYEQRKLTFADTKPRKIFPVFNKTQTLIKARSGKRVKVHIGEKGLKHGVIYDNGTQYISEVLTHLDPAGQTEILILNPTHVDMTLQRGEPVGAFHETSMDETLPIEEMLKLVKEKISSQKDELSEVKKKFISENANIGGSKVFRQKCGQLLFKHHQVISNNKYDIGGTQLFPHEIKLKGNEPVHVKQFRIPWAHREFLNDFVDELLQKGVIQSSLSPFNAPIFCVQKPHGGGLRVVQDFRKLNMASMPEQYIMREIEDCIDEIGKRKAKVFSTIDLTSGFWQQQLHPNSRAATAFTVPGRGRFEWTRMPMGLHSSPSSFAKLMDQITAGLEGTLTYLDDILVFSPTEPQHLRDLDGCLERLKEFGMKINIKKCAFNVQEIPYLGFTLTKQGIRPGKEKTKAVREFPEPRTVRQIREFTGLANYFRKMIPNYALLAGHLTELTSKKAEWEGPLTSKARKAFNIIKQKLVSAPILAYPRINKPFILATDASTGDQENPGGLGAVLSQKDETGTERVVAYASRSLRPNEKNYSAFLLEMAAAAWAIDHFNVYLRGNPFTLITDHKPLVALNNTHKKTLNRLQEQMNEYQFIIVHREGKLNGAPDALSRNPVDEIQPEEEALEDTLPTMGLNDENLIKAQRTDVMCQLVLKFLKNGEIPNEPKLAYWVKFYAKRAIIFKDKLYIGIPTQTGELNVCLWVPKMYKAIMLKAFHCSRFSGHEGVDKTFARIQGQQYWWPQLKLDVQEFVRNCIVCQRSKDPPRYLSQKAPMQPVPIPDRPNIRVHMDLLGPLKTSEQGNKYILVITDAFSKYTVMQAIPDKKAETVAKAFFEKWVTLFTCPKVLISDNGTEFVNRVFQELNRKFEIKHIRTASYHPQSNSPAESFNRTIIKYMKTALQNHTLDWEDQIPALTIAYNTRVHKSTLTTPFFLTFSLDPRMPFFDLDNPKPSYNDDAANVLFLRTRKAWADAKIQLEKASDTQLQNAKAKEKERELVPGQIVLVRLPLTQIGINAKFHQPWADNFCVLQKAGPVTYLLYNLETRRKLLVHLDRIKAKQPIQFCTQDQLPKALAQKMNLLLFDSSDEDDSFYTMKVRDNLK